MRRLQVLALVALTAVGVLASVGSAQGAPTDPFVYKFSFGGVDHPETVAINRTTGNVLILERGVIRQFDSDGKPADFPALGSPTISVGEGESMAVDNSGGPTQGNIYVVNTFDNTLRIAERIWSYAPDGSAIGGNPNSVPLPYSPEISPSGYPYGYLEGLGVMPDGSVRLFGTSGEYSSMPTDPTGNPTGPAESFPLAGLFNPSIIDDLGYFYAPGQQGTYRKYDGTNSFADLGETGLPVDPSGPQVDPSTHDLYSRIGKQILGVHYSDPLVEATPFVALDGIAAAPFENQREGFSFGAGGKRLYVAEGAKISVFERGSPSAPFGMELEVEGIRSTRAVLKSPIAAGGSPATFHVEYGTSTSYGRSTPEADVPFGLFPVKVSSTLTDLQPGTVYHARVAATNSLGTTYGPDKTFKTYSLPAGGSDPCPNALARKQTASQSLLDCRAYELASAPDTGGFEVESYLVPAQTPFPGFPLATDKLLYATHSGAVPGPWNATNKGPDPYVATRTPDGWVTDYEGLPSNLNPAAGSFASDLGEADSSLGTLAFAGQNLCSPCFTSGLETGIPLRLANGQLTQGMSGSLAGPVPASAKPEGKVAKYFSADGKHLIFASKYAFEPGANSGGDLTVYDRNLTTGTTQIASTNESGTPLTGTVSELDVSATGSRIITAKQVSVDPEGNEYVHPFMHIGSSPNSVDLAPGTTSGVLYAGMTADGSKAFFTSPDKLTGEDNDSSADLYEAEVNSSGSLALKLITPDTGATCNPAASANGAHWNTTSGAANCDAVAIAGGGGVASATGAVYFLSPESVGGKGTLDQPNLYLAQPGGTPTLVATLEPNNPLVLDSVKAKATRKTGDFQLTPNGSYAAFTSALALTGVDYFGFRNVFSYDANAGQLACPSCDTSGTTDISLAANVELAPNGLSLLADGRVFFTTRFPLALNDVNGKRDVYESSGGKQQLISAGIGPFDSALLSVSADGTDAFFFTRDNLVPGEDNNGALTRIYDARVAGGFFKLPATVPCKASDECHGPGTAAPGPADIKSSGKTTTGNVLVCPKNRVKKRGQCVKKPRAKKPHKKKHAKKRAAKTTGKRGGRNA